MAKVTLPLMSGSASGRFGTIVFDKRGIVREFVAPVQPNTASQLAARSKMTEASLAIGKISVPATLGSLRTVLGYRWYAHLVGLYVKFHAEALANYNTLTAEQKGFITSNASAIGGISAVQLHTLSYVLASVLSLPYDYEEFASIHVKVF